MVWYEPGAFMDDWVSLSVHVALVYCTHTPKTQNPNSNPVPRCDKHGLSLAPSSALQSIPFLPVWLPFLQTRSASQNEFLTLPIWLFLFFFAFFFFLARSPRTQHTHTANARESPINMTLGQEENLPRSSEEAQGSVQLGSSGIRLQAPSQ